MEFKSEKGVTGVDISTAIIALFIFVSLIATLIYNYNLSSKKETRKAEALEIAINKIEQIKADGIEEYKGKSEAENNSVIEENQEVTGHEGFFETVTIQDYADVENYRLPDYVKKATIEVKYNENGKAQSVTLSTILKKENI